MKALGSTNSLYSCKKAYKCKLSLVLLEAFPSTLGLLEQKKATLWVGLVAHLPAHPAPLCVRPCSSRSLQIAGRTGDSHVLLQRKAQSVAAIPLGMALWLSATWHSQLERDPGATRGTYAQRHTFGDIYHHTFAYAENY